MRLLLARGLDQVGGQLFVAPEREFEAHAPEKCAKLGTGRHVRRGDGEK
jgi:hypothetical protein